MKWKHIDSVVKKKFLAQSSAKKVVLTVFCDLKEPVTTDFFE